MVKQLVTVLAKIAPGDAMSPVSYEWYCPYCFITCYGLRCAWGVRYRHYVHRCDNCDREYVVRRESYNEAMDRLYPNLKDVRAIIERFMGDDRGDSRTHL